MMPNRVVSRTILISFSTLRKDHSASFIDKYGTTPFRYGTNVRFIRHNDKQFEYSRHSLFTRKELALPEVSKRSYVYAALFHWHEKGMVFPL